MVYKASGFLAKFPNFLLMFSWQGCAVKGTLNKEDAAFICAEAIDAIPPKGFTFEVNKNI